MRKIARILDRGEVLFVDDKGTGTTNGNEQDCLNFGFKFRNSKCYCYDTKIKPKTETNKNAGNTLNGANNFAIGIGNTIKSGINNVAIGFRNIMQNNSNNSIAIGKNAYTDNYGELSFSASKTSNRAKYSILQYDGVTTNNTATELFIGGHNGARFFVNESCESAYYIESKLVILDGTNNNAFFITHYILYKYANNTLTEVIEVPLLNQGDSALNSVSVAYAPVSSTPDYIEVKVTGLTSTRLEYNLILQVTEVKNV